MTMCLQCYLDAVKKAKENEKPDDSLKIHDPDIKDFFVSGNDIIDIVLRAYDRLREAPDDQVARDMFIVISGFSGVLNPVALYQKVRDDREKSVGSYIGLT
jgi:hypothetical protein